MAQKILQVFFGLAVMWPSLCEDLDLDLSENDMGEDRWIYRHSKRQFAEESACLSIQPPIKNIVKRFYSVLPYFDKDHTNSAFLHKFRSTVNAMSDSEDTLDKEAGFYATVLTPLVFLQQYRDTWCLLERFHRAIRLYQLSYPTEKRSALKLLQNLRAVNQKIRSFMLELPGPDSDARTTSSMYDTEEDELHDKKDKYIKELIKNLG